ncbi:tRNA (N6-isopentenyl adenosine(37)-C2)-methylthiotransferase MiaB [Bartonella bacilliformis]|uniref:tRNA-2-methylthio-N(6)-dimethylallyladenosine synthase n=2 Tax=Bartonella bacilliformis TaxID=774 RepID=MIAB_BARBK|nr:tRNA (N6-isopentenyl adenosine(37)-C2)-methylthiotransferase MiaB [Bartonella bacilliformis]A1UU39.1 RecName: Full=tRNA-2-methylthio-N(6)-dimethylallyladenosine synthase; AltName: Full=(Dimethylallyl)adenosine tRNA methylthiotransferase MiaB; AltName: Full=tRNA-i(6)A37 methylthiotransferase [Bartonella bacilliformis KC583]ABM44770.1 tRNA-i(6)A37 thiotransferase enzyme MiaB [Bartonella bacilliformis KC583]AMG86222.1 tRNA (N6-isopentenyl adenosine(37)-C2)-methylthiotransferase MiaB [Bartonella 
MKQSNSKNTPPIASKKVFIKTYGCQMNVYDSQRMNDSLSAQGYVTTQTPNDADLILVNTCHIREKAAEKLYSDLGRLRMMRQKRTSEKPLMIGVTGCVAQAEGDEILRRSPTVDLVVGPQMYHRLPELLQQAQQGKKIVETNYAVEDKFNHLPPHNKRAVQKRGVSAFLTVQEGCDKFCTFCVVPYTRGAEISRSVEQITDEARQLIEADVKEITLLGQNVNGWHGQSTDGKTWRLGDLLYHLAKLDGLKRLRYTTSHPRDMDESLIAAHRNLDILMPYLHLPVQSGSDRILKAMNRQHKAIDYLNLIEKIRTARPDIAFSGDFIVGFPGETDDDFEETIKLIEQVGYSSAYSFKYSPRPGTLGATMKNQVDEKVKNDRLQRLQALLLDQQHRFLRSKIGQTTDVLIEKDGRHPGQIVGRSPWLLPVVVDTQAPIGTVMAIQITNASSNSFVGEKANS